MEAQVTTEYVETQAASEDVTAAPSDAQENVAVIDGALGEVEQETPQVPPEPAPTPRAGPELEQAFEAGESLSPAERANLRAYHEEIARRQAKSEADRAFAAQQARNAQRENRERAEKLRTGLPDRLASKAEAEIKAAIEEGRNISPSLLRSYLKEETDSLFTEIEPVVLSRHDAALRSLMFSTTEKAISRDVAMNVLNAVADIADYPSLVQAYGELMEKLGERQAPGVEETTKLRAENARLSAEVERLTGVRGKGAPGAGGKDAATTTREVTMDYVQNASLDELQRLLKEA